MLIKALQALTIRDPETGNLTSIAYGTVAEVDNTTGASLISDGLAEEYSAGGDSVFDIVIEMNTDTPNKTNTAFEVIKGGDPDDLHDRLVNGDALTAMFIAYISSAGFARTIPYMAEIRASGSATGLMFFCADWQDVYVEWRSTGFSVKTA